MKWDFLACADLHLQDTVPVCRKDRDEFLTKMLHKFRYILRTAKRNKVPVLIAGDIFNYWKPSPWLLGHVIRLLRASRTQVLVIPGQHDLPNHNQALYKRSGLYVLESAGVVQRVTLTPVQLPASGAFLYGAGWEEPIPDPNGNQPSVLLMHRLVWKKKPFPGADQKSRASCVIKQAKAYSVIVTGDNHAPFVEGNLINCGSMLRSTVAQHDHQPRVYLCKIREGQAPLVKKVFLPLSPPETTIDVEQKEQIQSVREEVELFVRSLSEKNWDVGLNFRNNLKQFLHENHTEDQVKEWVWKSLEGSYS